MKRNFFRLLLSAVLMMCCTVASAVDTKPSVGDGSSTNPYQIVTKDNLLWFAEHVNSGNASACAILTADITVNTGVLDSNGDLNGTPSNTWTPIGGQNGKDYSGEFNGNGHTISGLYFNDGAKSNVGLFGKAVDNAHIHDLGISDSYFCGKDHVGGICGDFASGQIKNCWNGATIYAKDWNAGGISGSCWKFASIMDCYNIGKIMPCDNNNPSYGGICGAVYENENAGVYTISNCHTLEGKCDKGVYGSLYGGCPASEINNSFVKNAAAFASGEVCYKLNSGVTDGSQKWYQTLGGTDNFPVLNSGHGTVYYGYDGYMLTYSNSQLMDPSNKASYIDANGEPQTADNVTEITNSSSTLSAGWYVVRGSDVNTGTLTCNGEVHLILADGAKLTAKGIEGTIIAPSIAGTPGIKVTGDGNSLTIYGQTAQSSQLIAKGGNYAAGIGGGANENGSNITINGGVVTASSAYYGAGIGGGNNGSGSDITINGGVVTAKSGDYGAGIGGGENGSGSYITINGGTVTASSSWQGAGIGGGYNGSGSNITINGGTVAATTSKNYGAGIGGGRYASGSNITINGGTVTATGGNYAAGIGGGDEGFGSNITINGGEVTANGGENAAGIGCRNGGNVSNIKVVIDLIVYADNNNPPTTEIFHTNGYDIAGNLAGRRYVIVKDVVTGIKKSAIEAIDVAIEGVTNEDIIAIATNSIDAINAAINQREIEALKTQALAAIASAKAAYNSGKADALGTLGTEQSGPAVEVIDQNDKGIILYNPKKVNFIKVQTEE